VRRHSLPCLLIVAVAALVVHGADLFAQSKPRVLDKDTFMDMESVGSPAIAPDGSQIVFDSYGEIWVASVDDGQVSRIPVSAPGGPQ